MLTKSEAQDVANKLIQNLKEQRLALACRGGSPFLFSKENEIEAHLVEEWAQIIMENS